MQSTINTKELRTSLSKIIESVKRGERFIVLYKNKPAFQIVPLGEDVEITLPLSQDPLYKAKALGESSDGASAKDHDSILYGNDS